jgi:histidinol-phosphatase
VKPDGSLVSQADLAVDAALRRELRSLRPEDAIVSEEGPPGGGPRCWLIDPVDGTSNFVVGSPEWGTLIALERKGNLAAAVVSAPALGKRWWAARGAGAFLDGERLSVSGVSALEDALLLFSSEEQLEGAGHGPRLRSLARTCGRAESGHGGFLPHVHIAAGAGDLALVAETRVWDMAAPALVLEEAGGCVTDVSGAACLEDELLVSSNGALHDRAIACLGG